LTIFSESLVVIFSDLFENSTGCDPDCALSIEELVAQATKVKDNIRVSQMRIPDSFNPVAFDLFPKDKMHTKTCKENQLALRDKGIILNVV